MSEKFDCKKCGFCCRTLLENEKNGMVLGLSLITEEETEMFDPKFIAPFVAIGVKVPTTVIFHQLILSECPHINEKNECMIYEKRPLICRTFPAIPEFNRVVILPKCPQIGRHFTSAGKMCPVFIEDDNIEEALKKANIIFLTWNQKCLEKGLRFWIFNLATKKWEIQK
jgi:Fe-S-cluster containining protein